MCFDGLEGFWGLSLQDQFINQLAAELQTCLTERLDFRFRLDFKPAKTSKQAILDWLNLFFKTFYNLHHF